MANLKSAVKRIRVNEDRRVQNVKFKSTMRTNIKHVEKLVAENNVEEAKAALPKAVKSIDKAVQNGIVHQNNGDRQKSRLTKKVNQLSA
ncbi:SSU ribosomal protein S20P [Pelagirhabdus alkalitolerans]|uniref:Small ribosomal subunit protein bS20 n=1 Tax=Pelagirhabdus alkalitolerans TaxID=1612202 RepID=A0A1G6HUA2_9BACI|nr:30S ribosomal protein S20 [Pelagirhabdus alkalitolerans]SDB97812.1 SSU ribosomal protein S20P [Pelagirhabdus alkalitolerans]